jgi:hypothetical protein
MVPAVLMFGTALVSSSLATPLSCPCGKRALRAEAEAARRALVQEVRAARGERRRTCLCCGAAFDSRGRFNRLCTACSAAVGRLPAQMAG